MSTRSATAREGVLLVLLGPCIAAVLATEHGPVKLAAPLIPYGTPDQPSRAAISSAAMSPPLIRGR
ncbi:hypothetical protein D8770_16510 [Methylobacterium sp. DB1607]|nr:hypothetical protein [Methylobacterium sp. DB1607]